jgi:hypothetical protein
VTANGGPTHELYAEVPQAAMPAVARRAAFAFIRSTCSRLCVDEPEIRLMIALGDRDVPTEVRRLANWAIEGPSRGGPVRGWVPGSGWRSTVNLVWPWDLVTLAHEVRHLWQRQHGPFDPADAERDAERFALRTLGMPIPTGTPRTTRCASPLASPADVASLQLRERELVASVALSLARADREVAARRSRGTFRAEPARPTPGVGRLPEFGECRSCAAVLR